MYELPPELPMADLHDRSEVWESQSGHPPNRPVGLSILSVLHILGGIVLVGLTLLIIANQEKMREAAEAMGIPAALLIGSIVFLSILAIASGKECGEDHAGAGGAPLSIMHIV